MDKVTASTGSPQPHSPTALSTFPLFPSFPSFPTEVRLLIWRAAIPIDFSAHPLALKPYSLATLSRRIPPKTLLINRESRQETLKHFQRLELRPCARPNWRNWPNRQSLSREPQTQLVLWDKEVDVLTLDWWCLVA